MTDRPLPKEKELDGSYSYDQMNEFNSVTSATECTGLMYFPPENEYEAESYNEIYVVPKVANEEEKRLRADGKVNGSK